MSIFEWLFEYNNPHPTGQIEFDRYHLPWKRVWVILAGSFATALVLAVFYYWPLNKMENYDIGKAVIGMSLITAYLAVSYMVYPKPDYSNTGIFGFIDHPFRYTDDINRFLIFLQIVLIPGKIISIPIVNLWVIIVSDWRKHNNAS